MYSEELIEEVKACYPDDMRLQLLAEGSHPVLGRYLDDMAHRSRTPLLDQVLAATSLTELKEEARLIQRKINCYKMWRKQQLALRGYEL